ncbi:uncharacterized protein LOC112084373 [Eutrema salsugineum]|uniref:uncharacterized protein LOC112084373 n=1 Tax=Eutrema salsugineum TaxID=72664 RepID=UPI000CED7AA9|nr:uncharacterized protein LOC112084373 [Eutrema salsugineum]
MDDEEIKNFTLSEIEKLLRASGNSLSNFNKMSCPDDIKLDKYKNTLICDKKSYNRNEVREKQIELMLKITDEQLGIYTEILDAVNRDAGEVFFVYGFGGTGKTFL